MDALATIPQYLVGAAVLLIAFRELRGLLDTILKRDHSGARSAKVYVDRQLSDVLEGLSRHIAQSTEIQGSLLRAMDALTKEVAELRRQKG